MSREETILRFEKVSFEYGYALPILDEVDFSMRQGAKMALMGQNGAGKSTIFQLITGLLKPERGNVHVGRGLTVATARQVIPREDLELTVRAFFEKALASVTQNSKKIYDIDPRIDTWPVDFNSLDSVMNSSK